MVRQHGDQQRAPSSRNSGWSARTTRRGRSAGGEADLIEELAKVSTLTKKESEAIVHTVFDSITAALAKGDKVELRGFGSFRIRYRRAGEE